MKTTKLFTYFCLCAVLCFFSCEKDAENFQNTSDLLQITESSVSADNEAMILDSDNDGNPVNAFAKIERPDDCCRCEFLVRANNQNFPGNASNTWVTQVFYEGCNGETILQVGAQSGPNGGNVYNDPNNEYQSFVFFIRDTENIPTEADIVTFAGSNYNGDLPLEIRSKVRCEIVQSLESNTTPLLHDHTCNTVGTGTGFPGCGFNTPAVVPRQEGNVSSDCMAYSEITRD